MPHHASRPTSPVLHQIEPRHLHGHRFAVTLTIPEPACDQGLSLPVWIPGSYLVREFARHLSPLQASQGAHPREVRCLDKTSWSVRTEGSAPLVVRYEVYAFDTSVRAAFLDAQRGFFNGTSVFLRVAGREHSPQRVQIGGLPRGWRVATALPALRTQASGAGLYEAADHDELIDHPVEMGKFWQGEFTLRGVRHEFVVAGAPDDFDGDRLLADTRRICEAQVSFWHGRGRPPMRHYVFMLNAVEDGYGGLEHRASTALICGRKDLPRHGRSNSASEGYQTLLGLISHEYFHTWNVKRLKPTEFAPYDLRTENPTRLLWFFEGFTAYYDDQFLLRTGLIDAATYLKQLSRTVQQVQATPGRHLYSVAQASFDAWTRYYRPDENTANATVNYYTQGSLVALALDLSLRLMPAPNHASPTLDGVMLRLWRLQRPLVHADIAEAIDAEAGAPPVALAERGVQASTWAELLHRWTETCEALPLQALLSAHGVTWCDKPAPLVQRLGLRLGEASGALKVQAVMRDSLAEQAGISTGDELLALDLWRLRKAEDLATWHNPKLAQALLVCRDQRLLTLSLPPTEGGASQTAKRRRVQPPAATLVTLGLTPLADAPDAAALGARRQAWLHA